MSVDYGFAGVNRIKCVPNRLRCLVRVTALSSLGRACSRACEICMLQVSAQSAAPLGPECESCTDRTNGHRWNLLLPARLSNTTLRIGSLRFR
jgi:hypothetical protein